MATVCWTTCWTWRTTCCPAPRRRGRNTWRVPGPRREPEMREIARAWRDTGLPGGTFAEAAAEAFDRRHAHKDDPTVTAARLLSDLTGEPLTPHA
ncbi:hypothetical protein [Streptomyces sp. NPDC001410]|uniref:hypothetical protein n=2 Tax=unclassified Streptomyces TaxID=2593676 RepID=UPI0036BE5CEB